MPAMERPAVATIDTVTGMTNQSGEDVIIECMGCFLVGDGIMDGADDNGEQ